MMIMSKDRAIDSQILQLPPSTGPWIEMLDKSLSASDSSVTRNKVL